MKNYYYIQSLRNLNSFMPQLHAQEKFAFDTEFRRVETYYPISCLLQISFSGDVYIIDLMSAELVEGEVFKRIFENNKAYKICHSGRQDLEILYCYINSQITGIIDTQIAAKHAGFGKEISYGNLCRELLDTSIDKKNQFSNWTKRPLEQAQLHYAAEDVRYLEKLYQKLAEILKDNSNYALFSQECQELSDRFSYIIEPDLAWKKIKSARYYNNDSVVISRLKQLASMREESAMLLNVPRKKTISDEALIKISKSPPRNSYELDSIYGISKIFKNSKFAIELLELCRNFE